MQQYKLTSELDIEINPLIKSEFEVNLMSAIVAIIEDHGGTVKGGQFGLEEKK